MLNVHIAIYSSQFHMKTASVTGLMWIEFACLLHCAVKSVTFSVYNNADLNFTIYSVVIAVIAN